MCKLENWYKPPSSAGASASSSNSDPQAALCCAAAAIRAKVTSFRGHGAASAGAVLQIAQEMASAGVRGLGKMLGIMNAQDGFITSWVFDRPIWEADFGHGGPARFQGVLHPIPPWFAVVMTAHPGSPGLDLMLTVPTFAVAKLRGSRVLRELAPEAQFV